MQNLAGSLEERSGQPWDDRRRCDLLFELAMELFRDDRDATGVLGERDCAVAISPTAAAFAEQFLAGRLRSGNAVEEDLGHRARQTPAKIAEGGDGVREAPRLVIGRDTRLRLRLGYG